MKDCILNSRRAFERSGTEHTASAGVDSSHSVAANVRPAAVRRAALCGLLATVLALPAFAGTHTWTGASTSGLWSVGANWESNNPPFAFESPLHLVFPASATRRLSTNNIANISIDSMTFDGAAYTIAGTGSGTSVTIDSSVAQSYWNLRVNSGTGHKIHSSLSFVLNGTMESLIATNTSLEIGATMRTNGVSSGFSKDGPGIIALAPVVANSFDGPTTIKNGVLSLRGGFNVLGNFVPVVTVPGALIIGNTSATLNPSCLIFEGDQVADTSTVTVNKNGRLNMADVDDTIGALNLYGGVVDTGNNTLHLGGDVTALAPAGTIDAGQVFGRIDLGMLGRSFIVSNASSQLYMAAEIAGGAFGNAYAGITKLGAGTLALVNSNSYDGYTFINEGLVSVSYGGTLGSTNRGTSIAEGGQLSLYNSSIGKEALNLYGNTSTNPFVLFYSSNSWAGPITLNGTCVVSGPNSGDWLTVSGEIVGPGKLLKAGMGTLRLSGNATNAPADGIEVDAGVLRLQKTAPVVRNALHVGRPNAGILNFAPASLVLENGNSLAHDIPIAVHYGATFDLNDHVQSLDNLVIDLGTVETGSGALSISSTITNIGPLLGGIINGNLAFEGSIDIYTATNSSLTINGPIDGTQDYATFQKFGAGLLRFTKANHYKQRTEIVEGEMELMGQGDFGDPPVVDPVIQPDGLLTLNNVSNFYVKVQIAAHTGKDAVHYRGTNIYNSFFLFGPGQNLIRAVPNPFETNAHLTVGLRLGNATTIGYGGPVIFDGPGTVHIGMVDGYLPFTSLYKGDTWFKEGTLLLDHGDGSNSIPGNLTIGQDSGPSAVVRSMHDEQIGNSGLVTVKATGRLDIDGHTETIGQLAGNSNGVVRLADGELIVDAASGDTAFDGYMYGVGGRLTKNGQSKLTLSGINSYTGLTKVQGGSTLVVNGNQPQSDVTILNGTLGGRGRVGAVTSTLGTVVPGTGANTGILKCASYATNSVFSTLKVRLAGGAPGTGHDQLNVLGGVNLLNTTLDLQLQKAGAVSNQYMIVKNDGANPIFGTFSGLTNGATFTANGASFQIFYNGGDGNDVVLVQKSVPDGPQIGGTHVLPDGTVQITATGTPNATYGVEATTNLLPPVTWTNLGTVNANGVGLIQFTDADAAQFPMRFYRFVLP